MKKTVFLWGVLGLLSASVWGQTSWTFEKPHVWARDKDAITLEKQGDHFVVRHTGQRDWCMGGFQRIAVEPGEIFELRCRVKAVSEVGAVAVSTGVVLRDGAGQEIKSIYGGAQVMTPSHGTELVSRFVHPKNLATIEPRHTGDRPVTVDLHR